MCLCLVDKGGVFLCPVDKGVFVLHQERYQRDQKRMQAEWQSAQEGTGEEPRGTEVCILLI